MSSNITDEQQDLLLKYSTPALVRNTFLNTSIENIRNDYEECMQYNSRKKATERITLEKEIIKALQTKKESLDSTALKCFIGEEIEYIQKRITERSNRSYGVRLGKANKKLERAINLLEEVLPYENEYMCLNLHGFSVNSMYTPSTTEYGIIRTDFNGKARLQKTDNYKR